MKHLKISKTFAFNVLDISTAKAVIDAAADSDSLAWIQTSERIFEMLELPEFVEYIKSYAKRKNVELILQLDHAKNSKNVFHALKSGYDAALYDCSALSLSDNLEMSKACFDQCKAINKDFIFESEVGFIPKTDSELQFPSDTTDDLDKYISEFSPDLLAPAIGTAHGQYYGKPNVNFGLLAKLNSTEYPPLVIHGGTGLDDATQRKLLNHENVIKINISTEIKQSYEHVVKSYVTDFDYVNFTKELYESIYNVAIRKYKLLTEVCR